MESWQEDKRTRLTWSQGDSISSGGQPSEKFPTRKTVTKISVFQSETWEPIENLFDYYTGPNHFTMAGFEDMPFTYGVRQNGEIVQFHKMNVEANPFMESGTLAILVEGCFGGGLGVEEKSPTKVQSDALKELLKWLLTKFEVKIDFANAGVLLAKELV